MEKPSQLPPLSKGDLTAVVDAVFETAQARVSSHKKGYFSPNQQLFADIKALVGNGEYVTSSCWGALWSTYRSQLQDLGYVSGY